MSLFSGVGNWFLELFEINMKEIPVDESTPADEATPAKAADSNPIEEDLQTQSDTDDKK